MLTNCLAACTHVSSTVLMICEGSTKGTFAVITQKCNKTANINVKKLRLTHLKLQNHKKVILLSSTLTLRRCAGG